MSLVILGNWQDGSTSGQHPAQLHVDAREARLQAEGRTLLAAPLETLRLSPKLGKTPRYVTFREQPGQFETSDHLLADLLDRRIGSGFSRFVHRLEQHLLMVVLATAVVVSGIWAYFAWGIPAASKLLAQRLPEQTLHQAARETLALLEKRALHPSELPAERREEIRRSIAAAAPDYALEKLRFYRGGRMGANAFALPDGTIIFTDELVELSESADELLAVFGHELGHVVHRHSLRQIIQGSAISVSIALISGDVSAFGDMLLTAPVIFSQMAYSRKFELESDAYAVEFLKAQDLGSEPFAAILRKIHLSHSRCKAEEKCADEEPEGNWLDYLSTHPHLDERIRMATGTGG